MRFHAGCFLMYANTYGQIGYKVNLFFSKYCNVFSTKTAAIPRPPNSLGTSVCINFITSVPLWVKSINAI